MTERSVRNVLISGASIAGPALAFWLARYGIAVTIVEKASSLRGGGYPIDVRGTAIEAVERMGLYAQMRAAHVDTQSIGFVDANGAVVAKIDPEAITGGVRGKDIEIRRGQGSSMALVGACVLAGEIATNADYNSAFKAYEKLVRPFVEMNQALVDESKRIMIPDSQEEIDARNEMFRKMAAEAGGKVLEKNSSRQIHSALTLPDYS